MPAPARAPLFAKLANLIVRDKEELWELERVAMGRSGTHVDLPVTYVQGNIC